jgi:WD40 repeat protein
MVTNKITGLAYAPNGTQFVSCSHDMTLRIWDASIFQCIAVISGHTNNVGLPYLRYQ